MRVHVSDIFGTISSRNMLQRTSVISMFQLAHKKEPARTIVAVPKPKAQSWEAQFLFSGPEDCEPSVDPEDFGKGGVEVESEYDLEVRIGDNVGRPGMEHLSLLTVPNKTVRW
jgi:hypothetical protein